uniref:Uncharacterized protein n=1 Tax=Gopherus agassizii TaxID=38772 RepID=A0A452HMR7_9SAUR
MWPAGAASWLPCLWDLALRQGALSGNLLALSSHLVASGRSIWIFISTNPEGNLPAHVGPGTGHLPPYRGPREPLALQPRALPSSCQAQLQRSLPRAPMHTSH